MSERTFRVLIIDDEVEIRHTLKQVIEDEGQQAFTADGWNSARLILLTERIDVVMLDVWMPDVGGLDALERLRQEFPEVIVIMISGHASIDVAVECIRQGAFDFIEKPLSIDRIITSIQRSLQFRDVKAENVALRGMVTRPFQLIGDSEPMQRVQQAIGNVGPSMATVLITGENGSGKDLVARAIHLNSSRATGPYVAVNCAAIPASLMESELFGHEKGAFTGAEQTRKGHFEQANQGTLFLDEIGELPLEIQGKLLRVLEDRTFMKLGSSQAQQTDVRILAATNRPLSAMVEAGTFRQDLYYRLNVVQIDIPPLRDRRDDIPALVKHLLAVTLERENIAGVDIEPEAMAKLQQDYPWPGNVRELRNVIERLVILSPGDLITVADVETHLPSGQASTKLLSESSQPLLAAGELPLKEARERFEKTYIEQVLQATEQNVSRSAAILGLERSHLHKKIKQYAIQVKRGSS